MRRAAIVLVSVILLASMYGGMTGLPDLMNTAAMSKRAVGLTAVGQALLAPLVLLAMWRSKGRLQVVALLWAALFVARPLLEILVYQVDRDTSSLPETLATVTVLGIVATTPVLLYAWLATRAHRRAVPHSALSTPRERVLEELARRGRVPSSTEQAPVT
ncbi:MAG: hypothetical protein ABIW79_05455 [Gemmatimonas sp.]